MDTFLFHRNYTRQTSGMAVNCEAAGFVNSAVNEPRQRRVINPKSCKMECCTVEAKGRSKPEKKIIQSKIHSDSFVENLDDSNISQEDVHVGPSIHDGIVVTVDMHEFDISEDEMAASDKSGDDSQDESLVMETVVEPVFDQTVTEQHEGTDLQGNNKGEYEQLLKDPMLKKVFEQFYNERIKDMQGKQEGNSSENRNVHDVLGTNCVVEADECIGVGTAVNVNQVAAAPVPSSNMPAK